MSHLRYSTPSWPPPPPPLPPPPPALQLSPSNSPSSTNSENEPGASETATSTASTTAANNGPGAAPPAASTSNTNWSLDTNRVFLHTTPSNSEHKAIESSAEPQHDHSAAAQEYVYGDEEDEEDIRQTRRPKEEDLAMAPTYSSVFTPHQHQTLPLPSCDKLHLPPSDQTHRAASAPAVSVGIPVPLASNDISSARSSKVGELHQPYDENGLDHYHEEWEDPDHAVKDHNDPASETLPPIPPDFNNDYAANRRDSLSIVPNKEEEYKSKYPPIPIIASQTPNRYAEEYPIPHAYGPYLTIVLVCAWIALFIIEFGTDSWHMETGYINPSYGPSYHQLDRIGGKSTFKILGHVHLSFGSRTSEAWRLVTTIFWHAGLIHFFPSLLGLVWLGVTLERDYGPLRLGAVFFVAGIYGTIFSSIFCVDLLTVSASACVFGLLGARWCDAILYSSWFKSNILTYTLLTLATAIGFVIGLLPLIDNWAHLGSLVMGFLCGGVLFTGGWRPAPDIHQSNLTFTDPTLAHTPRFNKIRLASLIAILILFVISLVILFSVLPTLINNHLLGRDDVWCPSCRNFQCVDTAQWQCRPNTYYH